MSEHTVNRIERFYKLRRFAIYELDVCIGEETAFSERSAIQQFRQRLNYNGPAPLWAQEL